MDFRWDHLVDIRTISWDRSFLNSSPPTLLSICFRLIWFLCIKLNILSCGVLGPLDRPVMGPIQEVGLVLVMVIPITSTKVARSINLHHLWLDHLSKVLDPHFYHLFHLKVLGPMFPNVHNTFDRDLLDEDNRILLHHLTCIILLLLLIWTIPNCLLSEVLVFNSRASVLFDTEPSYSFISFVFASAMGLR